MKDLSIPQIAEKLDISDNTVRRYVKRFKDHLPPPVKSGIVFKYPESTVDIINNIYEWFKIGQSPTEIINNLQLMSCDKKQEDEWNEIEEMKDHDFRVGDEVTIVDIERSSEKTDIIIESVVSTIDNKTFPGSPVGVDYHFCETRYFKKDGTNTNPKCRLYHGHNLKVTVEEKKPIRTVERWVVNFLASNKEVCVYQCNTKEHMDERIETWPSNWGEIVNGPIKVQIPE